MTAHSSISPVIYGPSVSAMLAISLRSCTVFVSFMLAFLYYIANNFFFILGQVEWLQQLSACLSSVRLQVQNLVPDIYIYIFQISFGFTDFLYCFSVF
jgi:hypothetical protein